MEGWMEVVEREVTGAWWCCLAAMTASVDLWGEEPV